MNQEINLTKASTDNYSRVLPIKKFVLFNICSLGIYQLYWFYKNWTYVKEYQRSDISPVLRTILSVFFVGSLSKQILLMAKEKGYPKSYSYILIFIFFYVLNVTARKLPDTLGLIVSLFSFIIFIPVLQAANYYWQKQTPHLKINNKFSISSIIAIILGGLFVLMCLLGSLLPDEGDKSKTGVQLQDDSE